MARGYHWTVAVCAALFSVAAFATDYTWTGGGGDDHGWRTPSNWGQTTKYPVSGDRAIFPENCNAEVELGATNNYEAVNQLKVLAGANVRFYAADPTAETRLDLKSAWEVDNENNTIEFDHIRVDGGKAMVLGSGAVLTAKNGSDLRLGNTTVKKAARVSVLSGSIVSSGWIDADSSVGTLLAVDNATWTASGDLSLKNTATNLLSNGAQMKCNNLNINGPNTLISIDDAALLVKGAANLGTATPGGGRIVFKGDNPMLKSIAGSEFKDSVNNANMTSHIDFDFVVPAGGFAAPPIQWMGQQAFRNNGSSPNGYFRFNVLPSSPAVTAGTQTDCILFYSQNGITRSKATNGDASTATLRLADMTGATDATSDGEAKTLCATIGSGAAATPTATGPGCLLNARPTTVDRNVITANGIVTAIASNGDATHVELWCGTANNAATMAYVATVVPESAPAKIAATFSTPEDNGEVTYYFQWRLFDIGEGGVTNYTDVTDTFSAATKDTTTYTWQAVNGDWDGDWHDTAHWSSDRPSARGYPYSGNSTAVFPAGQPIVVTISDNEAVGTLDLHATKDLADAAIAQGVNVTFKGASETGTNKVLTVSTLFNVYSPLGTVTLDNAAIKVNSGDIKPGSNKVLRLVNGAYFYSGGGWETSSIGNWPTTLELHGKSVMSIGDIYTRNGKKIVIDDSRLILRGQVQLSRLGIGGDIVFMGANPVAYFDSTTANCFVPSSDPDNNFIFNVPVGGFDAPPIQCKSSNTRGLFASTKTTGKINFIVADESPCYATTCNFTTPLIAWTSTTGITTTLLTYAGVSDGGNFLLGTSATADYGFVNAASFSGTAKSLGVYVVSVAHDGRLTVASDASQPLDGYEPALGEMNGYAANDSVTLTAPTGVTSNGVHYTCTGYTLTEYAAGDAATVVATTTGDTSSFAYTFPAGRAEITWHYAESYPVTATAVNDAGGTVAKSADFTTSTSPVTLTASTVTDGMEFQYWYGDVPYESRYANPLVISGDQAKSVTAFFGATAANGATRLLSYEGNVGREWFNTAAWTGGVIPGTNDTAVLLNTSTYNLHQSQNKGRVIAPSFVAVKNLVVSNATLFVGARYARFDGSTYENSNPAQYWWTDQNGHGIYHIAVAYDIARTEPVGLDVFGDVILDSHNRAYSDGNSGGVVFVGGTQSSCNTRVNVAGDLDIENGTFQIVAGYPFDFVPDPSTAVNLGFIPFDHPEAFFRGGNYLKAGGKTFLRTPTATKTSSILHVVNDFRTGAAVWLDLQDVEIGEGAYITSYCGGYGKFDGSGNPTSSSYSTCPGGHQTSDTFDGGCHGGLGGKGNGGGDGYDNPTEYATTYDYELTPIYPGNANGGNSNTRGAGSIRLDCTTLDLDGGLLATGHSGSKGGSAGGSIWVICDTFNAGDSCQVFADGGNKNCGGGGGRIAICEGLTDEQVTNLWAIHAAPQDVTVTDLADKLGARMTVAGGTGILGKYSKGYPGTAFYLVNTAGKKTLTVAGDPANLGTPAPAYGPQVFDEGENIAFSAPGDAFATDDNRSRRVAVGYTITDTETGAVIADENATSGVVTLTGDWTLTWDLTLLQHSLDISAATPGGTITTNAIGAAGEAWQDDGSALSVTAVPASGYRFAGWFGEIAEAVQYDATFSTNVTGALRVRAVFVSDDADTATWTGAGDGANFLDAANWSTGKVPGPKSAVVVGGDASVTGAVGLVFNVKSLTVASGASLAILPEGTYSTRDENPHVYPETISSYDLHDCGIVASGDIYVAGTLVVGSRHSLAKATAAAGGAFTIAEGASATVNGGYDDSLIGATATPALWRNYGAVASAGGTMTVNGTLALYGDALSGSPVKVAANRLMIGETGVLRADEGGWGWKNYHGARLTYALGAPVSLESYNGGAYGGFGGGYNGTPANVTDYGNKRTYGEPLRPYLPGSPGPNNDYPFGGGALRIDVEGQISNAGRISANGTQAGGSCGGGSGGSVWMSCTKFVNAAGAMLSADGGKNTDNGGGGGGGRILVCEKLDAAKIDALYATGVVPAKVTATEITDANRAEFSAGAISADGGVNVKNSASYPCWSGTAGSIWWLRGRGLGTFIMVR